jgi:hypothetical protein
MSSAPETEAVMFCQTCGASIYREHLNRGIAGHWAGHLLCAHCLAEQRDGKHTQDLEPLSKADEVDTSTPAAGRSSTNLGMVGFTDLDTYVFKRPMSPPDQGATRVRIFHCKLSDGPLTQLNRQINAWLDAHPDVQIKHATTNIGTWEGRHSEQHIIITLYY